MDEYSTAVEWSDEFDTHMLRKWKDEAEVRERGHRQQEMVYRRLNKITMLSCLIVSGIGATSILTLFDDCTLDPITYCDQYFDKYLPSNLTVLAQTSTCGYQKWFRLGVGILTAITTTAMGIREYLNLGSKADNEKEASYQFGALARAMDELLLTPWPQRAPPNVMLPHIRTQYDHLVQASPTLPDHLISAAPGSTSPHLAHVVVMSHTDHHDEDPSPSTPTSSPTATPDHGSHESSTHTSSSPTPPPPTAPTLNRSDTMLAHDSVLDFELTRLRKYARRHNKDV